MPLPVYECLTCQYQTRHKAKHDRHMTTKKHHIASDGIVCCGSKFFDKTKWINHKRSLRHMKCVAEGTDKAPFKGQYTLSLTKVDPVAELIEAD